MNSLLRRAALAALLAGTASATAFVMSAPVQAARAPEAPKGPTVSAKVAKPLIDGQKAFNAKDLPTALAKAKEAEAVEGKTPYETYQVAKLMAVIYLNQNDLPAAAGEFNRAIESGGMPEDDKASTYRTAMLLNYNGKDYAKASKYGAEAAKLAPLDDQGNLVLSQSYYFANDFAGAENFAKSVVAAKTAAGTKPDKALLETMLNAQLKQNNQAGVQETIGQIALADPSPENWSRVIDQGFAVKGMGDHHYLNLYRLKNLTNSLNAQDYLAMSGLALKQGLAQEGKTMLQKGIQAGTVTAAQANELLTQANALAAKDQAALADFEKLAATAPNGEAAVKLGETHYVYGRLPQAEEAIKSGIAKGGLKDLADAQLTLGIVLLSQGKKDEARQMFTAAAQSPVLATSAHAWALYSQT